MGKLNKKQNNISIEKENLTSNNSIIFNFLKPKKDYNFKIVVLIGFVISFILLIFTYKYFGSYFETNDDPRFVMQMKGNATPLPFKVFWLIYTFTVDAYVFLYKNFPKISWYGISMFFLLQGTLLNFFISLYLASKKRINIIAIILIFIAFYFLIFFQNVYWMNFTRPSILATSSFIILLGSLYLNSDTFKKNKWVIIFPIIIFIPAFLNRMDAGILGLSIGLALCVLLIFNNKPLIPFVLKYILPVIIFMSCMYSLGKYNVKKDTLHQEYFNKLSLFQNYFDFRNAGSFVPKNITDTIAFNALNARYVGDDNVISDKFLNRLINESTVIENANEKKLNEELTVFNKSLEEENNLAKKINYSFIIIMFFWFLTSMKSNILSFIKYILFQMFFIVLILAIGYFMKLPARIYSPLLSIFTISNVIFLFHNIHFDKKQYYFVCGLPLLFILSGYSTYSKSNSAIISNIKQYGKINKSIIDDMNNRFNNTVFLPVPLSAWEMHTASDPIKEINFKNNNCYAYLSIDICTTPETKDQLMAKFGAYDHSKLFEKISETSNAIFISDASFNNFLVAYYHYIYHQDYYFEKAITEIPPFNQFTGLDYYRLKKIK